MPLHQWNWNIFKHSSCFNCGPSYAHSLSYQILYFILLNRVRQADRYQFATVITSGRPPREQGSWGQNGAQLGPVGPRWAPYRPRLLSGQEWEQGKTEIAGAWCPRRKLFMHAYTFTYSLALQINWAFKLWSWSCPLDNLWWTLSLHIPKIRGSLLLRTTHTTPFSTVFCPVCIYSACQCAWLCWSISRNSFDYVVANFAVKFLWHPHFRLAFWRDEFQCHIGKQSVAKGLCRVLIGISLFSRGCI